MADATKHRVFLASYTPVGGLLIHGYLSEAEAQRAMHPSKMALIGTGKALEYPLNSGVTAASGVTVVQTTKPYIDGERGVAHDGKGHDWPIVHADFTLQNSFGGATAVSGLELSENVIYTVDVNNVGYGSVFLPGISVTGDIVTLTNAGEYVAEDATYHADGGSNLVSQGSFPTDVGVHAAFQDALALPQLSSQPALTSLTVSSEVVRDINALYTHVAGRSTDAAGMAALVESRDTFFIPSSLGLNFNTIVDKGFGVVPDIGDAASSGTKRSEVENTSSLSPDKLAATDPQDDSSDPEFAFELTELEAAITALMRKAQSVTDAADRRGARIDVMLEKIDAAIAALPNV